MRIGLAYLLHLSAVLLDLLQQCQVVDRVLAIITDNASNLTALMSTIHELVQSLEFSTNTAICPSSMYCPRYPAQFEEAAYIDAKISKRHQWN
jgi:predicted choloylglycine hydrolase